MPHPRRKQSAKPLQTRKQRSLHKHSLNLEPIALSAPASESVSEQPARIGVWLENLAACYEPPVPSAAELIAKSLQKIEGRLERLERARQRRQAQPHAPRKRREHKPLPLPDDPGDHRNAVLRHNLRISSGKLREFLAAVDPSGDAILPRCSHAIPLLPPELEAGISAKCPICALPPNASQADQIFAHNAWYCALGLSASAAAAKQFFAATDPLDLERLQALSDETQAPAQPQSPEVPIPQRKRSFAHVPEAPTFEEGSARLRVLFDSGRTLREIATALGLERPEEVRRLRAKVEEYASAEVEAARTVLGYSDEEWREFQLERLLTASL